MGNYIHYVSDVEMLNRKDIGSMKQKDSSLMYKLTGHQCDSTVNAIYIVHALTLGPSVFHISSFWNRERFKLNKFQLVD